MRFLVHFDYFTKHACICASTSVLLCDSFMGYERDLGAFAKKDRVPLYARKNIYHVFYRHQNDQLSKATLKEQAE